MADRGAPVCPSLFSFKGMRSWLDRLLLWAIFLSIALQNAAVDYVREKTGELPSPKLNSSTNVVRMGQNVSLSCSSQNTSLDITYSLFLGTKHIETKKRRGETIIFHLKISNVNETGPYKCKTNVSNLQKYSQELNFMIAKEDSCPSCLLPWLLPGLLLGLLEMLKERVSPRIPEMHPCKVSCMQTFVKLKQRQDNPRSYTISLQSSRR
ncbi:allergin-1 isoform X3 [Onychomys torridus]|uniref:allergin-1 isoform X3 n=1 Tax=Onychomys torridus TaxID=38674 RepID=UPI00167FB63C|nr:allergin-1 isoform X3 [Onychomys torridus]